MDEPLLIKKDKKIGKNQLILGILLISIVLLGSAYAFFNYNFIGDENNKIIAGEVYLHYSDGNTVHLSNAMFPETPEEARGTEENPRTDNIITFTIDGKNTTPDQDIYYEIRLMYGNNNNAKNRFKDSDLRFDLEETIDGVTKRILSNVGYETINNTKIWVDTVKSGEEVERTYTLRVWIGDHVLISDTNPNASYTTGEYRNSYTNVKVGVFGDFSEKEKDNPITIGDRLKVKLENHLTEPDSEGVVYVSGNKTDVTNNYVWYSGKLWRIFAIYPNGNLKIVTDTNITTIAWGADTTYYSKNEETGVETKSWMYEWLNEDFLDTLYDPNNEIIVRDYEWNATESTNYTSPLPKTTMVEAPVGLVNTYEYYKTYQKATSYGTGYLNVGYYWWLINPYNSSNVQYVDDDGYLYNRTSPLNANGARPSINLSSNITLAGSGTKEEPYRIDGDITIPENGITKLNERISGEYVNFNGEKYRIVSIENGITKITKTDFIRNTDGTYMTKGISSSITYGSGTSTSRWDYYLNNDWYNSLATSPVNYKGMIVEGTYYLGWYPFKVSYKQTICDETIRGNIAKPINGENACTRISDTSKLYIGKVGLGRVGEMFTSQQGTGYSNHELMWTITPYSSSYVRYVTHDGYLNNATSPSHTYGARPSINLSSNIVITDGDGTINRPFEINFAS